MTSEYMQLNYNEAIFAKKNLLHSQLGLLTSIKRVEAYKKLRNEELKLKIELKKKLEEARVLLDMFEKLLPKTKTEHELEVEERMKEKEIKEYEEAIKKMEETKPIKRRHKKHYKSELEKEIDEIKHKLSHIH